MKADDITDIKLRDDVWHLNYKAGMTSNTSSMALVDKSALRAVVDKLLELLDNEAGSVCAETYILVGQLQEHIPNAEKWLDNLAEAKMIHKDLLPVSIPEKCAGHCK